MFFTHLTAGSFRENISHAEQGWANPGRINELEVPEPSGGSAQGPALPCSSQPALFSSSSLIYAHRQDRRPALLPCGLQSPQTSSRAAGAAGVAGMMKRHVPVRALPGTGWTHNGCAGEKDPSQAKQQGNLPKMGRQYGGEKGFYSGAGKLWVGETALVLSLSPHRAPIPPQSLIALGEPQGKEWEGEAETDAKH